MPAPRRPSMLGRLLRVFAKPAGAPADTTAALLERARACFDAESAAGDAECEQLLTRVLAREPENPLAHFALGLLLTADARFAQAEPHLRRAHAGNPREGYALYTLFMVLLQRNNYPEGFRLFGRWRAMIDNRHTAPHIAALPAWRGEALAGKRIVLWTDWGGFGDDFAFLRFARAIRETHGPAQVIVAARAPLARLFAAQPYVDAMVALEDQVEADFQCPFITAPEVLGTQIATLPAWPAYIEPPAGLQAQWAARLAGERRLKVGLVWTSETVLRAAGDPVGRHDKHLPDALLAQLAGIDNLVFVSLQKGKGIPRAATLLPPAQVIDFTDDLRDFADTAALMRALDLVLTIDTGTSHLAGALGVPALLPLRKSRSLFWAAGREDSSWYPGARTVTQSAPRDWAPVLTRIRAVLERRAAGVPWPQCCERP